MRTYPASVAPRTQQPHLGLQATQAERIVAIAWPQWPCIQPRSTGQHNSLSYSRLVFLSLLRVLRHTRPRQPRDRPSACFRPHSAPPPSFEALLALLRGGREAAVEALKRTTSLCLHLRRKVSPSLSSPPNPPSHFSLPPHTFLNFRLTSSSLIQTFPGTQFANRLTREAQQVSEQHARHYHCHRLRLHGSFLWDVGSVHSSQGRS